MVSFVDATSTTALNTTSITGNKPSGVVAGDLLLALFAKNVAGTGPNLPSGWAQATVGNNHLVAGNLSSFSGSAPTGGVGFYWKEAGDSEPDDYTFSGMAAGTNMALTLMAFRDVTAKKLASGWNTIHLFDGQRSHTRSSNTLQFTPTTTWAEADLTADQHIIICAFAHIATSTTCTLSALTGGLTEVSNEATSGISMIVGYKIVNRSSGGSYGTFSCTTDTASGNAAGRSFIIPCPTGAIMQDDKRQASTAGRGYSRSRVVT